MAITLLSGSIWQWVQETDRSAFLFVNRQLPNPFFDAVLPFFRESVFWAPFYLFIFAFVWLNWGRRGVYWSLAFLCTVGIADLLGTYALKETVQRLRPCNDVAVLSQVRLVILHCPGGYSFVSNHAANHFGLATFMAITLGPVLKQWKYLVYLWAALIAFAQVYVGVHYPLDVLAGALLGLVAGTLTASVYRANFGALVPLN